MPLNAQTAQTSLAILLSKFSTDAHDLVRKVHFLVAESNIKLDAQSPRSYAAFVNLVAAHKDKRNRDEVACQIFAELTAIWREETRLNQEIHKRNGHYHTISLDKRGLTEQMEDHDFSAVMPKPVQHIEVLAALNRTSSSKVIQKGFKSALQNRAVKHIIIPIGPGHFQGLYLTKPTKPGEAYQLELFDPFGPDATYYMDEFVKKFLADSGISDNVVIKRTGPKIPQKDTYSCGDYTSIYSHKKMQEFKAPAESYSLPLIKVLDEQGNTNHALRTASRAFIAAKQEQKSLQRPKRVRNCQDASFFKSDKKRKIEVQDHPMKETFHEGNMTFTEAKAEPPFCETPKEAAPQSTRTLTPEDIAFIDEKASTIKNKAKSSEYKDLLTGLIEMQETIFSAAKVAERKMAGNQSLNSEELAALLQAEELQSRPKP